MHAQSVETSDLQISFGDVESFGSSVTDTFTPIEVTPYTPGPFQGHIEAHRINEMLMSAVRAPGHVVSFTESDRMQESFLKIYYPLEGTAVVRQGGQESAIFPGELAAHDTSSPYQIGTETGFRCLILMLPESHLQVASGGMRELRAVRFTADQGPARLVLPYLAGLANGLDEASRAYRLQIARTTTDLLTMMFNAELGERSNGLEQQRAQLRGQIEAWIDAHLMDEDLSPGRIAAENFISKRSLHYLFAEVDTTVGAVVRERRLTRAGEVLISRPDLPIVEVARLSGFLDPSYFTRIFKAEYGHKPGEHRSLGTSIT